LQKVERTAGERASRQPRHRHGRLRAGFL